MMPLRVVGLGRGDLQALERLQQENLDFPVVISPSPPQFLAGYLEEKGKYLVDLADGFCKSAGRLSVEAWKEELARFIVEKWKNEPRTVLALPGKPEHGGGLLQALRREAALDADFSLEIVPGEDIRTELIIFLEEELETTFSGSVTLVDAWQLAQVKNELPGELVVTGVCSAQQLPGIRDWLLRWYPSNQPVHVLQFGDEGVLSRVDTSSLDALGQKDQFRGWFHLHLPPSGRHLLGDMIFMMEQLRAPDGCPWDRKQDHKSLQPYLVEEAYEVIAAIQEGDSVELCEELGDLLLQVVFHSCLAWEQGDFSLGDVVDGITRKIYRRHPHVFSGKEFHTVRDISQSWQEIKEEEKKEKQESRQGQKEKQKDQGRFSMPREFPALIKAQKVQKRAADVGFDWPDISGALDKLQEELEELKGAYSGGNLKKIEEEMGDLFFALVNVARFMGVDAELVLNQTVEKFKWRFQYIEEQVQLRGGDYNCFTLEELDCWWDEAKTREKNSRRFGE